MRSGTDKGMVRLLLASTTWRHWRREPRQTALLVCILALGVAVYLSIRLANRAAVASFANFTGLVTEESDWVVTATAGDLPETVLVEMREALGTRAVDLVPVLETTATPPRRSESESMGERPTFTLVGVDLVSVQNAAVGRRQDRAWFGQGTEGGGGGDATQEADAAGAALAFWRVFTNGVAVFVPEERARRDGLKVGSRMPLLINDAERELLVAGIVPRAKEGPNPPSNMLVMDLPALQAVSMRTGRLDRVEFRVAPGHGLTARRAEVRDVLARLGEGRWRLATPSERREAGETMTRAFRLNLTILSLLALLVGLYLVFQALDGAVVRRREEIGILRSLGVTATTVRRAWLAEAALLGLAGGLMGALMGWAGAQGAVRLVGRTMNALYQATSVRSASMSWEELCGALVLSVAAAVVAGWWPARVASGLPPAQVMLRHAPQPIGGAWWTRPWVGLMAMALGGVLSRLGPLRFEGGFRFPAAGYGAALAWVLGGGVVAGALLGPVARMLGRWSRRSAPVHLALAHLRRPSGRHRLAAAGLLVAVAMTSGMAILVASFDRTMRGWIERTFQADLYISSDGAQSASTQNRIPEATWRAVVNRPEVADWNVIHATPVQLGAGETILAGADLAFSRRHAPLAWRDPPYPAIWDPRLNEDLALVSEAFVERFGLGRGAVLELPTPTGTRRLRVAGVFSDYGNERGSIVVERVHYERWHGTTMASSIVLALKPGAGDEAVRSALRVAHPGLQVLTNAHLRREVLRVFRQTFAITHALELIGVVVAVAGLGMTLAAVLLERRGTLTTLRALGMTRGEMARATAVEGMMLAGVGGMGGLVASLGLGWLLIFVVNRQTFGWTLQYTAPWATMAALMALVMASAALVSWAVGRWGADLPSDREE